MIENLNPVQTRLFLSDGLAWVFTNDWWGGGKHAPKISWRHAWNVLRNCGDGLGARDGLRCWINFFTQVCWVTHEFNMAGGGEGGGVCGGIFPPKKGRKGYDKVEPRGAGTCWIVIVANAAAVPGPALDMPGFIVCVSYARNNWVYQSGWGAQCPATHGR